MMLHFPQFSDNFSRESSAGKDTMFGKTQCGIETGKCLKSLWDILRSLWKFSTVVKSFSEILILPEQKSHAHVWEKVGRFIIVSRCLMFYLFL